VEPNSLLLRPLASYQSRMMDYVEAAAIGGMIVKETGENLL
jgi:hypothetical protein